MPSKLDFLEQVEVTSRAQWRAWLEKHHMRTEGIWLITYKKIIPHKHLGWDDIVEEALCFGWIDSVARKLDEERRMLYLCPRKPRSVWSKVNKARIVELMASKRMADAGLNAIDVAKKNGSWSSIDAAEAHTMPIALIRALAKSKLAKKHFEAFPPSTRKAILQWIHGAKTDATRTRRVEQTVALAAKDIRATQQGAKDKS